MIAPEFVLRPAHDVDYDYVISRVDGWWGGRDVSRMLPRLFFEHFPATTIVAEDEESRRVVGFICGFRSEAEADLAYIHFVGVDPEARSGGLGRTLYEWFFARAHELGCRRVKCVTSPANSDSLAFHAAMGFAGFDVANYDGPDEDRVVLTRALHPFG